MKRILARLGVVLLTVLVFLLAGVIAARVSFMRYLHGEAFRRRLGDAAARSLHADSAEFAPLEIDGAMVYGENFHATRNDGGGFSTLGADQLRAAFDWHGLLHHTVQIDEMAVQKLDIEPPAAAAPEAVPENVAETAAPLGAPHRGWTVDLRKAVINEVDWHWSDTPWDGFTGVALTLRPGGSDAWVIDAQGGTLKLGGWPDLDLDSASMRWQAPTLYINSAELRPLWRLFTAAPTSAPTPYINSADLRNGSGLLSVSGSIVTRDSVNLQVKLDGVEVTPLLTPDWRRRLSGKLAGEVNVQAPLGSGDAARELRVSGSLGLVDGQLTAVPILDEIGTFTRTERFRTLELTRASADFAKTPEKLQVSNLVVESEGLIRVEGEYTVVNGQIDGNFEVGLTPPTLQWIPGSQELLFTDSRAGYRWTPMRLTGPVSHPSDDLTPRLVAATAKALMKGAQGVEGVVRKTGEGVLDLLLH